MTLKRRDLPGRDFATAKGLRFSLGTFAIQYFIDCIGLYDTDFFSAGLDLATCFFFIFRRWCLPIRFVRKAPARNRQANIYIYIYLGNIQLLF